MDQHDGYAGEMELTCPKCHGTMRSYERNQVTIDQCTECRGIFLDRGELERLTEAENTYYRGDEGPRSGPAQGGSMQPHPTQPGYAQPGGWRRGSPGSPDSPRYYGGHDQRRSRRSFLQNLFD